MARRWMRWSAVGVFAWACGAGMASDSITLNVPDAVGNALEKVGVQVETKEDKTLKWVLIVGGLVVAGAVAGYALRGKKA